MGKVLSYKSAERLFNLSKCCIIGPQVEPNLSDWPRSENLIFSHFEKNIRSFAYTVQLGDRGDFQSIRILLRARRVEKAIAFLCLLFKFGSLSESVPNIHIEALGLRFRFKESERNLQVNYDIDCSYLVHLGTFLRVWNYSSVSDAVP